MTECAMRRAILFQPQFVDPRTKTKSDVTAFVANLAASTDEEALRSLFSKVSGERGCLCV